MDTLLALLENNIVLSGKKILGLRSYIEEKHPNENSLYKANILAGKINTIIDASLYSCNTKEKENIRSLLIDRYLIKENKPITHFSVFSELLEYDNNLKATHTRLTNWLSINYEENHISENLENYIINNRKREFPEETTITKETVMTFKKPVVIHSGVETEDVISANKPIESVPLTMNNPTNKSLIYGSITIILLLVVSLVLFGPVLKSKNNINSISVMDIYGTANKNFIKLSNLHGQNNIPYYLRYKNISKLKLINYLENKQSILTSSTYLDIVYKLSNEYNINPLLVLSIVGQEQNFVPKNNIYANEIINNPYNVFGSWKSYNTNFEDSTRIVINTIINRLIDKPYYEDPFKWLNETYAEDELWWQGVKRIFRKLDSEVN